jgi:hypothetical protein
VVRVWLAQRVTKKRRHPPVRHRAPDPEFKISQGSCRIDGVVGVKGENDAERAVNLPCLIRLATRWCQSGTVDARPRKAWKGKET